MAAIHVIEAASTLETLSARPSDLDPQSLVAAWVAAPENRHAIVEILSGRAAVVPIEATEEMCLAWDRSSISSNCDVDDSKASAMADWSAMLAAGRFDKLND